MGILNLLTPTRIREFFRGPIPGTSQLMTIADGNNIINALNNINSADLQNMISTYEINWQLGTPLGIAVAGGGVKSCPGTCKDCSEQQIRQYTCDCNGGVPGNPTNKYCGKVDATTLVTGTGTFTLTLSNPTDINLVSIVNVVQIGNPSNPGDIITVNKIDEFNFEVSVYNALAGSFVDETLNKVPLTIISTFEETV